MYKILVVDDEKDIREVLKVQLEHKNYEVKVAFDGMDALEKIKESKDYDLIILDIMMPRLSGLDAAKLIREITNIPILFLTAKSGEKDILAAYSSGGDDFLSKPFSRVELFAKVEAIIRRYRIYKSKDINVDNEVIVMGEFTFNLQDKSVHRNEAPIVLTNAEADILFLLLENRGVTFDSKQIYESIWNEIYTPSAANTIMVHMFNLRKKLGSDIDNGEVIKTVWGKGYRIEIPQ